MSTGLLSRALSPFPTFVRDRMLGPPPAPPLPERPDYWRNAILTHHMADSRRLDWERILAGQTVNDVLEVGSYEGQSALFWHHFFGRPRVTCIDTWTEVAPGVTKAADVEDHFDTNAPFARKVVGHSTQSLSILAERESRFDLIYIDGDHSRLQVLIDSALAWPMLAPGGVMIWDDYEDYRPDLPESERPELAVRAFMAIISDEVERSVSTGQQFFAWKYR